MIPDMDWLERKQQALKGLEDRYGEAWVREHWDALEDQWNYISELEGFNPETGEPIPLAGLGTGEDRKAPIPVVREAR